jgi:hypothetical protein
MNSGTPSREQLIVHLTALGLDLDDASLEKLLPVYAGVISGAHRLATLDLGEAEPAMIFRQLRAARPEDDAR